jgi:hypothetical protein
MPVPGLSLVGLLPDAVAVDYFEKACCYAEGTDLASELASARSKLSARTATNAGDPELKPLPASCASHEAAVRAMPRFRQFFETAGYEFRTVEIAPLLACQPHVTLNSHAALDPLHLCLPLTMPEVSLKWWAQGGEDVGSRLIAYDDLNFRVLKGGASGAPPGEDIFLAGVGLGIAAPFIQVLRWKKRCYLVNGFHRAYTLLTAGSSEMPCLYREIDDPDPATMLQPFGHHLQGVVPSATVGDFALAHEVPLRKTRREITVSWSQLVVPVE